MISEQAAKSLALLSGITTLGSQDAEAWERFWPDLVTRVIYDLDEAGNDEASKVVTSLLAEVHERLVPPMTLQDEYQLACARMDKAREGCPRVRRWADKAMRAAYAEYEAAQAALARFEASPGIPLPRYDPLREAQDEAGAQEGRRP